MSPGEVLVNISKDGGKWSERLELGSRAVGPQLDQSVALQIKMRLHHRSPRRLARKRGRRQDLCHKRIRIQRNRSHQLLQLLRSLLRIRGRLRACAGAGWGLARPDTPPGSVAKLRTTAPATSGKPRSVCPLELLKTSRAFDDVHVLYLLCTFITSGLI